MSTVSIISLPVRSGEERRLVRLYERLRVFELARESGGLRCAALLQPITQGDPFLVVAEWERPEDYDRWLESPVRARLSDRMTSLLEDKVTVVGTYRVVQSLNGPSRRP